MSFYSRFICSIMVFLGAMLTPLCGIAQEDVLDYRHYKFYDDDPDELWWLPSDTLASDYSKIVATDYMRNALYTLATDYRIMRDADRQQVANIPIGYNTARLLTALNIRSHQDDDARLYDIERNRATSKSRHTLQGELSGRGYIGALTFRATYPLLSNGVRLKDNNWTITHYARARAGRDIYISGAGTNSLDAALDISHTGRRGNLSIVALLPWSQRALTQHSTAEAFALTNDKHYNPLWGYDGGKVRNSRIAHSLRPEMIVALGSQISYATKMQLSANVRSERLGTSSLAWYDAITPQADNYRYMPSYYANTDKESEVMQAWQQNDMRYTQIDWHKMRHTNALQRDGEAAYAVEQRRENRLNTSLAIGFTTTLARLSIDYGLRLGIDSRRKFKIMEDLLGGEHIIDKDYFLEDDDTYANNLQNDLRNPNRKITVGDRFGYDYRITTLQAVLYTSAWWQHNDLVVRLMAEMGNDVVVRRGYYEKEIFPSSGSYGLSQRVAMSPFRVMAVAHYLMGQHSIVAKLAIRGTTPESGDIFLQPQYNNRTVEKPRLRKTLSAEVQYLVQRPRLKLQTTLFLRSSFAHSDIVRYYDDLAKEYSNATISGIGNMIYGLELSGEARWTHHLSSQFLAVAGDEIFTTNPDVSIYADRDNRVLAHTTAMMKRVHGALPHVMCYANLIFRRGGWQLQASAHYLGARFAEPSMIRRTLRTASLSFTPEERHRLNDQQRLKESVEADIMLCYTLPLAAHNSLRINLMVRNVLGRANIKECYEPHRLSITTMQERQHIAVQNNLLSYGYGRSYALVISWRF